MTILKNLMVVAAASAIVALSAPTLAATSEFTYSPQLGLIGVTDTLQNSANNGAGITFGVIDTGAAAAHIEFGGRVSTNLSACTIAGCPQSLAITDDNGHGTFTTSEIIAGKNGFGIVGVDPLAKAIEMKVLNAAGSGYVSDVAKGIKLAADRGANILNLSLTFVPTPDLIAALNYAAAKNVLIVFAGGNSAQAFQSNAHITGLTDAAIQRILVMGSTNASKALSWFSNTPGTGGFVSTTGKFTPFANLWLMADGENIWGASNYHDAAHGYSWYTQMSGTSMAAPQGAGAEGLLAARWPFLLTTGKITEILLKTGQDLGAAAVDANYGSGFLRVDNAFSPIGQLMVAAAGGKLVSLTGAQIASGGPTGSMSRLSGALSKAVAYDSYKRDFAVNLSSAIVSKSSVGAGPATSAAVAAAAASSSKFVELAEGGFLAINLTGAQGAPNWLQDGFRNPGLIHDPTSNAKDQWSFALSQGGTFIGAGQGGGAAMSFGEARWSGKSAFWGTDTETAASLLGLTQNASYAAAGLELNKHERVSFAAVSSTDETMAGLGSTAYSRGFAAGYTFEPTRSRAWQVSLTSAFLNESGMLLGSPAAGALAFGTSTSMSFGAATNYDLGHGFQLGFDATAARTHADAAQNSLFSGASELLSFGFGAALSKTEVFGRKDALGITVKQPLRVYGGSTGIDLGAGTDINGNPIVAHQKVSLVPTASETAFGLAYNTPIDDMTSFGFNLSYRKDADNVVGVNDAGVMARLNLKF
jgi:hypothetical protein